VNSPCNIYMEQFWLSVACVCVLQVPVIKKEYGAITCMDFSPIAPYQLAVTNSTRVCWLYSSTSGHTWPPGYVWLYSSTSGHTWPPGYVWLYSSTSGHTWPPDTQADTNHVFM